MRRPLALLVAALLAGASALPAAAHAAEGDAAAGGIPGSDGFTIKDPRITESSGLAASRQHPGVYWTHNDQDTGPYLYAVDGATGETVARVSMAGVGTPRDVEAIAIGPGNRIFVGDIGDNDGVTWPYVWIYELPEPAELKDQTIRATQYVVKYTDGSRDAESMVVHPTTGRVYIIDKQRDGGHLYEGPAKLSATGANVFRPTGSVDLWATDAAFSPDGERLAVRGYLGGAWYDWNGGDIRRRGRISVPFGQGESVTYTVDGAKLLLGMEGLRSPVQAQDAPGGGGGGEGERPGGKPAARGRDDGGDGDTATGGGTLGIGSVALIVGCVAVFGLRRLFRRR
ncbi:esterase-like activity of phytase family protein [Streptomyces sp. SID8352]|uniref:esterase-like activity of phytase family protein n=1 Tax=Streptomyces sp. SID8352 TaxID=2690338 RepID=UPI00136BAF97|nr:esterase-like activity of phytase family protein [Streptomyces sp. SID8352]MYU20361.1 WD40 repeat domain-containing protein [Streptomyces sp. SID8352]